MALFNYLAILSCCSSYVRLYMYRDIGSHILISWMQVFTLEIVQPLLHLYPPSTPSSFPIVAHPICHNHILVIRILDLLQMWPLLNLFNIFKNLSLLRIDCRWNCRSSASSVVPFVLVPIFACTTIHGLVISASNSILSDRVFANHVFVTVVFDRGLLNCWPYSPHAPYRSALHVTTPVETWPIKMYQAMRILDKLHMWPNPKLG